MAKNEYKVSVIIPMYNSQEYIIETLGSIKNQEYNNFECIIIDDHSTDNSVKIVNEFVIEDNRFNLYTRPDDLMKGPSSCRNYGLNIATGDYIQWFDSDDIMLENCLSRKIERFSEEIQLDVVVSKLAFIEKGERTYESKIESDSFVEDYTVGKISFFVCGPMWKSDFLKRNNANFDVRIKNLDDWDFNIRMLLKHPNLALLNEVFILYRRYPESLSKKIGIFDTNEILSEVFARTNILKYLKREQVDINGAVHVLELRLKKFVKKGIKKKKIKTTFYLVFLYLKFVVFRYIPR